MIHRNERVRGSVLLAIFPLWTVLACSVKVDPQPPDEETPDFVACHVEVATCLSPPDLDDDGEPFCPGGEFGPLTYIGSPVHVPIKADATESEKEDACENACSRDFLTTADALFLDEEHCSSEVADGDLKEPPFGESAILANTCPPDYTFAVPDFGTHLGSPLANDLRVSLEGGGTVFVEGKEENVTIRAGRLGLRTDDFACEAGSCPLRLSSFWVEFEEFTFKGRDIADVRVALDSPFDLGDATQYIGGGTAEHPESVVFTLPEDMPLRVTGTINDVPSVDRFKISKDVDSHYSPDSGETVLTLAFDGTFADLKVSGTIEVHSVETLNLPPHARAGADLVVAASQDTCLAAVELDARDSHDEVGPIRHYLWMQANRPLASTAVANVDFPLGSHELLLRVTDERGSISLDSRVIDVVDTVPPIPACTNILQECTGVSTPVETSCTATDACDANATPEDHGLDEYPLGHHVYACDATDAAGNSESVECTVDIIDSVKPVFTFVPANLTISACDHPNIGQAIATDLCGPVLVSNDAPDKFPLGETVVTWYALDHGNNQVTATQRVRAVLGDDASCCPEGTNVMVGTPGVDTLNGTSGSDCIIGLAGDDHLDGKGGDDFISAGDGNDTVSDLAGHNLVLGGKGNDILSTGNGNDVVLGNDGVDTCNGGLGTNAVVCEVASMCTAACCATQTCGDQIPDPQACGATYTQSSCLSLVQGSVVERNGHNWLCSNGNCRNCASDARCAPGGTGCPWGTVWTDQGVCH
jgi:hypothetical protein